MVSFVLTIPNRSSFFDIMVSSFTHFRSTVIKNTKTLVLVAILFVLALVAVVVGCMDSRDKATVVSEVTQTASTPANAPSVVTPATPSPYSVTVDGITTVEETASLNITIKGPAANLTVTLTRLSDGKSTVRNFHEVQFYSDSIRDSLAMGGDREHSKIEGRWVLEMKTRDPEKVVWRQEFAIGSVQVAQAP